MSALAAEQRIALTWTRAHTPELHMRVISALAMIMARTGRTREAHDELGFALDRHAIDNPTAGWAAITRAYTSLSLRLGKLDGHLIAPGIDAIRAGGDDALLAVALRTVSVYAGFTADFDAALAATTEAISIQRRCADPAGLAAALLAHAEALIAVRHIEEAAQVLAEAEAFLPSTHDSTLTIGATRGDLHLVRGDWALAAHAYGASAAAAQLLGSTEQLLLDLQFLALALIPLGEFEAALELESAAATIGAETGEWGIEASSWAAQWDARREQGRRAVGPERAAAAAARGRALPASRRAARAVASPRPPRVVATVPLDQRHRDRRSGRPAIGATTSECSISSVSAVSERSNRCATTAALPRSSPLSARSCSSCVARA